MIIKLTLIIDIWKSIHYQVCLVCQLYLFQFGFNNKGLPMGMQIIANVKEDNKLINFAKSYEEIFNFSKFKPELSE